MSINGIGPGYVPSVSSGAIKQSDKTGEADQKGTVDSVGQSKGDSFLGKVKNYVHDYTEGVKNNIKERGVFTNTVFAGCESIMGAAIGKIGGTFVACAVGGPIGIAAGIGLGIGAGVGLLHGFAFPGLPELARDFANRFR